VFSIGLRPHRTNGASSAAMSALRESNHECPGGIGGTSMISCMRRSRSRVRAGLTSPKTILAQRQLCRHSAPSLVPAEPRGESNAGRHIGLRLRGHAGEAEANVDRRRGLPSSAAIPKGGRADDLLGLVETASAPARVCDSRLHARSPRTVSMTCRRVMTETTWSSTNDSEGQS
jgi:hypothetical protein